MKRILALFIAVISLVLCGCQESAENIGVFKGGKQLEKRALRMSYLTMISLNLTFNGSGYMVVWSLAFRA